MSHYLGGRYENLYVSLDILPEMSTILEVAAIESSRILALHKTELQIGWWLNVMRPGDVTYPHTHDANEELLSGVYYIDAPFYSGSLILTQGPYREQIEPSAGMFVFFAPDLLHEVTQNRSDCPRLSIGLNIGRSKAS
ncbi:MAG: 2OG-Fe(II) oxygenase family protein [Sulfuricaulis sp.]